MPTIKDLAKKRIGIYTRPGWQEGEYVHAESMLENRDTRAITGVATCWCAAPIPANHPEADDDQWQQYTGPEAADLLEGPELPGRFFGQQLPPDILALLLTAQKEAETHGGEAQVQVADQFEVPAWQVMGHMRA